ncbi:MAG: hypothetical protein CMK07_10865 [Ponticaulis sp.]|nr:hypothetical protein [Ponticaulis sp.]
MSPSYAVQSVGKLPLTYAVLLTILGALVSFVAFPQSPDSIGRLISTTAFFAFSHIFPAIRHAVFRLARRHDKDPDAVLPSRPHSIYELQNARNDKDCP